MRFIDELRKHPIAHYGTRGVDTVVDLSDILQDVEVFDVNEVARHMFERVEVRKEDSTEYVLKFVFRRDGAELLVIDNSGDASTISLDKFVALVPPYPLCWFEYNVDRFYECESKESWLTDVGILVQQVPTEEGVLYEEHIACAFVVNILNRTANSVRLREESFMVFTDSEGRIVAVDNLRGSEYFVSVIALVAMMFLNLKFLTATKSEPPVAKTPKQEKYWQKFGAPPQHHICKINIEATCKASGVTARQHFKMALHKVRAHRRRSHQRHYKSGKVVEIKESRIRAHKRGDENKGIVYKDYAINRINLGRQLLPCKLNSA
jgi:hypothetical protein